MFDKAVVENGGTLKFVSNIVNIKKCLINLLIII